MKSLADMQKDAWSSFEAMTNGGASPREAINRLMFEMAKADTPQTKGWWPDTKAQLAKSVKRAGGKALTVVLCAVTGLLCYRWGRGDDMTWLFNAAGAAAIVYAFLQAIGGKKTPPPASGEKK